MKQQNKFSFEKLITFTIIFAKKNNKNPRKFRGSYLSKFKQSTPHTY